MIVAEQHAAQGAVNRAAADGGRGAAEAVAALLVALERGERGAPPPAFWAAFWPALDQLGAAALTPVFVALGQGARTLRHAAAAGSGR